MENENIVKQFLNRDDVMAVIASTNSLEWVYELAANSDDIKSYTLTAYFKEHEINPLDWFNTKIPYGCFLFDDSIEIEIPDGIIEIGKLAFAYMPNLESVILPTSIESIASAAFTQFRTGQSIYLYYPGPESMFKSKVNTAADFNRDILDGQIRLICSDTVD